MKIEGVDKPFITVASNMRGLKIAVQRGQVRSIEPGFPKLNGPFRTMFVTFQMKSEPNVNRVFQLAATDGMRRLVRDLQSLLKQGKTVTGYTVH